MKKIIFSHYMLILVLTLGLLGLYFLQISRIFQMVIFLSGSIFYMVWGVGHHSFEGRTDKHVFSEYILLGLIGLALTLIVFFPYL